MPKVILVDGTDGSGKTTSRNIIRDHYEAMGKQVLTLGFPGHDDFGQHTRPWFINDSEPEYVKLLAILTEFARFLENLRKGKYDDYDVIVLDRFILSTAHQVNMHPQYVPLVRHFLATYHIDNYLYFVTVVRSDYSEQRLSDRAELNKGDIKAAREKETTNFVTYAKELRLTKSLHVIDNNGDIDTLKATLLTHLDQT